MYVCSAGVVFATRDAMRAHMKSDWHKFNLKRKTQSNECTPTCIGHMEGSEGVNDWLICVCVVCRAGVAEL